MNNLIHQNGRALLVSEGAHPRILVCGGRHYNDAQVVDEVLDGLLKRNQALGSTTEICEGGASGADALARFWAESRRVQHTTFPADWWKEGNKAGPLRNARMLKEFKPNLVIAFPGGRGTADMLRKATRAGVRVLRVDDLENLMKEEALVRKIAKVMRISYYRRFLPYRAMVTWDCISRERRERWLDSARVAVEIMKTSGVHVEIMKTSGVHVGE